MPNGEPLQPIKVYEGVWRGPQPRGVADWNVLKDLGVKFTLDLQTGSEILGDGSPLTEALLAEHSLQSSTETAIREMKLRGMHWWYYWWAWFL